MTGAYFAAIEALTELADQIVFGYPHSVRVSMLAEGAATAFGWSTERVVQLKLAALLHDIGHLKSIVDRKSFERIDADSAELLNHPTIGADYLSQWTALRSISSMIANHQERLDGRGYPKRLSGVNLSIDDQLLSLADVYIALTNRNEVRARAPMSREMAVAIISNESGKRWRGDLVVSFLAHIEDQSAKHG